MQFYPHDSDIVDYADKLLALPNTIVLDHFASVPAGGGVDQAGFKTVLRMLDTGRVWVKLSGPMRCTHCWRTAARSSRFSIATAT